jgi:hypothetical protein
VKAWRILRRLWSDDPSNANAQQLLPLLLFPLQHLHLLGQDPVQNSAETCAVAPASCSQAAVLLAVHADHFVVGVEEQRPVRHRARAPARVHHPQLAHRVDHEGRW